MKIKGKNEKGITLVALIVTIIILVILTTVAVRTITNTGIISGALDSTEKYSNESIKEEFTTALLAYQMEENLNENADFSAYMIENGAKRVVEYAADSYAVIYKKYCFIVDKEEFNIKEIMETDDIAVVLAEIVVSNIKISLKDSEEEVADNSQELGTKLQITFDAELEDETIESISPALPYVTNGIELEKEFLITGKINNSTKTKTVKISLEDKYEGIAKPEITLSTEDWTNEDVTVTVDYKNIEGEGVKREISLDGGTTFANYTAPVDVGTNTTIIARTTVGSFVSEDEKDITKIDKLEPKDFTETMRIVDNAGSTKLSIGAPSAGAIDEDETTENGKSGIRTYKYYIYEGTTLIAESGERNIIAWGYIANQAVLEPEKTYKIVIEAIDNAGNVRRVEKDYTKQHVYAWTRQEATEVDYNWSVSTTYNRKMGINYVSSNTYPYIPISENQPVLGYYKAGNGQIGAFIATGKVTYYSNPENLYNKYVLGDTNGLASNASINGTAYNVYYKVGSSYVIDGPTYTYEGCEKYTASKTTVTSKYVKIENSSENTIKGITNAYPADGYQDGYWYTLQGEVD